MKEGILIEGLDRAEILVALFNAAKIKERPNHQPVHWPEKLSLADARNLLKAPKPRFSWMDGRIMRISLEGNIYLDPTKYDQANGEGLACAVISTLRSKRVRTTLFFKK